jgi:hypothetical protein
MDSGLTLIQDGFRLLKYFIPIFLRHAGASRFFLEEIE